VILLERGRIKITVNTARQIAHVLEINVSELFRGLSRIGGAQGSRVRALPRSADNPSTWICGVAGPRPELFA
jgi:hypothetical protein